MKRTNKVRAGGLFSLQDMGSSWLSRTRPAEDISVEEHFEEIAEEIEEDIVEVQDYAEEPEVSIMEEVQEQPSVSNSRENYSYTSISEAEESEKSDGLQEALEVERRATAEALKNGNAAKAQHKAALKQERKEKEALATALRKKRAERNSLRDEVEHLMVQVDDLKKCQKDQQRSKAKLKGATAAMTAEIEEDKKLIEKLQKDLEASSCQHRKRSAKRHLVNCAEIKALKDSLTEQQVQSLEKDDAVQSLHLDIQKLQSDIDAKDTMVSTLQEEVNQWASDLNEERTTNSSLQRDYEAAVSQQLKEAEELNRVMNENQRLASESKRLQSELAAALNESELHRKQLRDDREAFSGHEEAIEKEKALSLRAFKVIEIQEKELSERTLALERSRIGETFLRSSLRSEQKRFDQVILEKQALVESLEILSNQLRDASAGSETLMHDMQTLRVENADVRAKFHVMETEYDRFRSKHRSLSERHEEMTSKKNETISENQITIRKLQCAVDGLKEQQSESETRRAQLEDALKPNMTRVPEKQQRADLITSALDKERFRCEKHRVELKEALTRQVETLEEKQTLAVALRKARDDVSRLQGQLAESNLQLRHIRDTELRLNQQRNALDESTKALHHLQREYTDLGRRHGDIHSDHRELLKTHSGLQMKYERLCYAQGKPRPHFSPPQFTI